MARQMAGYMGPFSGTLGTAIGYMWNGKWCMRSRPTAVHNPRTPEQVAHREMFKREVQLAADLRDAIVPSMSDMARQMGMTSYNLFVSVNQGAFSLVERDRSGANQHAFSLVERDRSGANQHAFSLVERGRSGANQPNEVAGGVFEVDWQNLRLSLGDVAPVESARSELKEHNVLEVRYDKGRGYSHDLVRLVVYAPGLKRSLMSKPAFRKDKKVAVALPDKFVGEELQVRLLVQSPDGQWSESVWVPFGGEAAGSEELKVKNEVSAGVAAESEELRVKNEESAGAAIVEAPPE